MKNHNNQPTDLATHEQCYKIWSNYYTTKEIRDTINDFTHLILESNIFCDLPEAKRLAYSDFLHRSRLFNERIAFLETQKENN